MKWKTGRGGLESRKGQHSYSAEGKKGKYEIDAHRTKGYHLYRYQTKGEKGPSWWSDLGWFNSPNKAKGKAVRSDKGRK